MTGRPQPIPVGVPDRLDHSLAATTEVAAAVPPHGMRVLVAWAASSTCTTQEIATGGTPRPDVISPPSGWVHRVTDGRYGQVDAVARAMELVNGRLLYAGHVARVHCPISWPEGERCLNCHRRFPCGAYVWASDVLTDAGWSAEQIKALDVRTGPWS